MRSEERGERGKEIENSGREGEERARAMVRERERERERDCQETRSRMVD